MQLTVDHGKWLALAITLLAAMALLIAATRNRSWRWRTVGIGLPLLASVFVALGLAGTAAGKREVVLLLDLSPSTRTMPWRDPAWIFDLARRHLGEDCDLIVVGFHGDTQEIIASAPLGRIEQAWPSDWKWMTSAASDPTQATGTDIDDLLAWRTREETDHPQRRPAPRWIVTDGLFAGPRASAPPKMDVAWTILPPKPADVAVTDVHVRPVPGTAGDFELLAQIRVATRTKNVSDTFTVHVDILRDDETLLRQDMSFHTGSAGDAARWISVRDALPESAQTLPHHYKVTATLLPVPDPWPENDRGELMLPAATGLRTLVIGDREPAFPHAGFIKTDRIAASAEQLAAGGWQTIVLHDVPAEKRAGIPLEPLSSAAARQIELAVEGNGTGLLILGNGHAFGPGRYGEASLAGQILERLSPLASRPIKQTGRHTVFLLDASASMNEAAGLPGRASTERKISWAASGIQRAATHLPPGDRITVIAFNNASHLLFEGPASATMDDLGKALSTIAPSGATAPDSALSAVSTALGPDTTARATTQDSDATRPLLVLLTDGEIEQMNPRQWRQMLSAARAKLIVIAPPVPAGSGSVLHELAAIPDAMWTQTADPATWNEVLMEAVMSETRGTLNRLPLHWTSSGIQPPLTGNADAWTRGWLKENAVPSVLGSTDSRHELPLAAIAQRGLGKVAALAISDDGSPNYRPLLERLTQEIAAPAGDPRFTASVKRLGDRDWLLSLDGIGDGGFLNAARGETFTAQVVNDQGSRTVTLSQTAPGRYETKLQADGVFFASIVRQPSNQLIARVQFPGIETAEWPATIIAPFTPSAPTDIVLSPSPEDRTHWNPPPSGRLDLAPACWLAAALCALAALWLRR